MSVDMLLAIVLLLAEWRNASREIMTISQGDRHAGPRDARSARISAPGRHVVFSSYAGLVPEDAHPGRDIYVLDRSTGRLTLESIGVGGTAADGDSTSPDISADGRYIVFVSTAGNLTGFPVTASIPRVFLRDRETGTNQLLATSLRGRPANRYSSSPAISADGRTIVFESAATDLIEQQSPAGDSVALYLFRVAPGMLVRVDVSSLGEPRPGSSASPAISADGRYVAFMSRADLTCRRKPMCPTEPADTNGVADVYLHDTLTNTTTRVSRSHAGLDSNGPSYMPAISGDGRHVAFISEASNLTRDPRSRVAQVYVREVVTGVTELVSQSPRGRPVGSLLLINGPDGFDREAVNAFMIGWGVDRIRRNDRVRRRS